MRTGQARPKYIQAHQPAAEVQIDEKTLPLLRVFGCPVVVLFALVEGGLCGWGGALCLRLSSLSAYRSIVVVLRSHSVSRPIVPTTLPTGS